MTTTKNSRDNFFLELLLSMVPAILFCLVFLYINDFISVPLRQISSALAAFFLKIMNFSVVRTGTLLTISGMKFDVVPACSGSGFITVLTVMGIIWCGIRSGMTLMNRVSCMVLAIPVAVLANGLRVAVLTGGGFMLQREISQDILHSLIGLLAFIFSMMLFFLLTEAFVSLKPSEKKPINLKRIFIVTLGILLFFIYLPFFFSCFFDWRGGDFNQQSSYAWLYVIAGGMTTIVFWQRQPEDYGRFGMGAFLFCLSTAILILFQQNGINNYVQGISLLVTVFSLALMFKGKGFAISIIPLLLIILSGYPKVSGAINHLLGLSGYIHSMLIRLFLAVMLFISFRSLYANLPKTDQAQTIKPKLFIPVLIFALATFVFQAYLTNAHPTGEPVLLKTSYLYKDWDGRDIPLGNTEIQYFKNQRVVNRIYQNGPDTVGLLIVSSSVGRKKIHTPEYCQTGDGWNVLKRSHVSLMLGNGKPVSAVKLMMKKKGYPRLRTFIYWFSDGEKTYSEYSHVVLHDTLRAFKGKKAHWFLNAVWTDNNEDALNKFLSVFNPSYS